MLTSNRATKSARTRGRPRAERAEETQRYQLLIPTSLYGEVKSIAEETCSSIPETFRKLIKYGMLVFRILKNPDAKLIIREGDQDREVILL